jgi:diacylglycerol kinase (ATP)
MLEFSELKRMLFIINPVSGKRMGTKYLSDIIRMFYKKGYAVTTMVTARRGDATAFASEYAAEYDIVVCIGGDGTLNEVVTGLARAEISVDLGYIPAGSTNDFASCHALSSDVMTAAENIADGKVTRFDLGRFGENYFTYVAAFGAFSWLSYTTPQNLKNVFGHSAYIFDAVRDLPKIKSEWMSVMANGTVRQGSYIFGAICSSTSVAGLFELPKDLVDTGDGLFEVILVREPPTIIEYQQIVKALLTQDYGSSPLVEFFQTDSLLIETRKKHTDWSLDGEHAVASQRITVENMRQFMSLKS